MPKPVISGGEEDLANLVLRLAISQMIAERAGQPLSLLVLDEVFGSLDESRRQHVAGAAAAAGRPLPAGHPHHAHRPDPGGPGPRDPRGVRWRAGGERGPGRNGDPGSGRAGCGRGCLSGAWTARSRASERDIEALEPAVRRGVHRPLSARRAGRRARAAAQSAGLELRAARRGGGRDAVARRGRASRRVQRGAPLRGRRLDGPARGAGGPPGRGDRQDDRPRGDGVAAGPRASRRSVSRPCRARSRTSGSTRTSGSSPATSRSP